MVRKGIKNEASGSGLRVWANKVGYHDESGNTPEFVRPDVRGRALSAHFL